MTVSVSGLTVRAMLTFQQVLDHFGGTHASLAKALGISRTAVTMWREKIPQHRAYQIEVLSNGALKAADLPIQSDDEAA